MELFKLPLMEMKACHLLRCEGPLNGGFCSFYALRARNSFAYDPNPNSFNDSQNLSDYPPQPQYQTYSYELCGNDAHYGYDCPPQVSFVYNQDPCFNLNFDNNFPQTPPKDIQELLHKLLKDLQMISEELADYINTPNWNFLAFYEDDDEEYTISITPVLPTEEPDNSLSMGDEHLSTILETESDELIKSSVENLVPIPSESEDFSDIKNDSLMEEIDIFLAPDDSIPPGIENDDHESEGDILFLKNCLAMIPFPFLKLSHFTLIIIMFHHPHHPPVINHGLMLMCIFDIEPDTESF
ncbi:hypothetical protein Tco_0523696 [Tanacetum coccineum]